MNAVLIILIAATAITTYINFVRPVLKRTATFSELYTAEGDVFRAVKKKFAGLKQRLATIAIAGASFVVAAYDSIQPYFVQSGIQLQNIHSLAAKVPAQAWPFILGGSSLLLMYLRKLADDRNAVPPSDPGA